MREWMIFEALASDTPRDRQKNEEVLGREFIQSEA
jgi:hypothetical protein